MEWELAGPLLAGILSIVLSLAICRIRQGAWVWDLKKKYGITEEDKG